MARFYRTRFFFASVFLPRTRYAQVGALFSSLALALARVTLRIGRRSDRQPFVSRDRKLFHWIVHSIGTDRFTRPVETRRTVHAILVAFGTIGAIVGRGASRLRFML